MRQRRSICHFVGAVLRDDACRAVPSAVEDVKRVIVALQPVTLRLMAAMAYEDGKSRQAEALVGMAKIQKEPASAQ